MATFLYTAQREDGSTYSGSLDAEQKSEVYAHVGAEGATVINVTAQKGSWLAKLRSFLGAVKMDEKIILTRTFSAMLNAGLSVSRALSVLERQTKNPMLKRILATVQNDVAKGLGLHEAFAKHPKVFDHLFVSMVKAGEESGGLADALITVGRQMERSHTLVKKVRSAMIYPSIIILAIVGIAILMLIFVVPTLTTTFAELGVELPASTQAIVSSSNFLQNNPFIVLGTLILFGAGGYYGLRTDRGKRMFGTFVLYIPVVSGLVKETYTARSARTLSSLLSSGVEVLHALTITKEVIGHPSYKKVFDEAYEEVKRGESLSHAFESNQKLYPVLMGDMIAVGEETGSVANMLLEVAEFYESEVETKTKDLSTVIEPFLMILIAVVVGIFAISMIAPIYSITESI